MGHDTSSKFVSVARAKIAIGVLGPVFLIFSFAPQLHFWGIDSLRVFPVSLRFALTIGLLVLLLPSVSGVISRNVTSLIEKLSARAALTLYVSAAGVLGIGFVFLCADNGLMGDGYTIMSNMVKDYGAPFEPLAYRTARLFFLMSGGGTQGAMWAYQMNSFFAGAVFLVGLGLFTKDKRDGPLLLATALCFGVIEFFCGYIELYALSFVFMFFYILSARRDLEERKISVRTVVLLLLAIGYHLASGALVPTLLYLAHNRYRSRRLVVILSGVLLLVLTATVAYSAANRSISQVFVPVVPTSDNAYSLFSLSHLSDLANAMLLSYPLLLVAVLTVAFKKMVFKWFYAFCFLCLYAFTALVDPTLSGFRDWDLLSFASAPVLAAMFSAIEVASRNSRERLMALLAPLLVLAVMHTGSWIYYNTDKIKAYEYMKSIAQHDIHYSGLYYGGSRLGPWQTIVNNFYQDRGEVVRALEAYLKVDPDDDFYRYQLALTYSEMGKVHQARELVNSHWESLLRSSDAVLDISEIFHEANDTVQEEELLDAFINRCEFEYRIACTLRDIMLRKGVSDLEFLRSIPSIRDWANASVRTKVNFFLYLLALRHDQEAAAGLTDLLPSLSPRAKSAAQNVLVAIPRHVRPELDSLSLALRRSL